MGLDKNIRQVIGGLQAERSRRAVPAEDFDFSDAVGAVWRRKALPIAAMAIGVALAWVQLERTVPLFAAESRVLWDVQEESVTGLTQVVPNLSNDWMELGSQIEIVHSGRLLGRVADELDAANDPVLNGSYSPLPEWTRWASPATYVAILKQAVLDLTQGAEPEAAADAEGREPTDAQRRNAIVANLRGMVAPEWLDGTYVMSIRAVTPDPEVSARLANTVAQLYILDQLDTKFEATRQATDWLTERVAGLKTELEAAESRVEAFVSETSLVSEEALAMSSRQVKDLRKRADTLAANAEIARTTAGAVAEAIEGERYGMVAELLSDPRLERLAAQIEAATGDGRTAALARFDAIATVLQERLSSEAKLATEQRETVLASIAALDVRVSEQSEALVEQRQLIREAEATRLVYEFFLGRLKEISVQEGIQRPDGRILTEAEPPAGPSSPSRMTTLATGLLAGLIAGALGALLIERSNSSYRAAHEIESRTGKAVIGTLPMAPTSGRRKLLRYLLDKPNSLLAEAVRNLRTSLLMGSIDRPPKVIMTTSSMPGEGKTTTCLALARMNQSMGKRTLLIECDLRRRTFRSYFDLPGRKGVLSVLSGETPIEDVIVQDKDTGLWILPGEESTVSAADVFSSQAFADFIAAMREQFDFVLIDTPPVLAVPDARVIAAQADAVLFVTRWNRTPREVVDEALRLFSQVNVEIAGIVLSQVDTRRMQRYGKGYAYYREAQKYYQN